ncbi:hypothetical protein [Pseudoalteromonas piscicida]|uniref:Uncharacterized protein n=1 Tax=Pseudoalteromonas piscicida TaxID=43662 RepID=A0AAD0W4U3_PSEO7|nr:hypothetical protein [Pseudoalteromonas piscicida]ASD66871.1 hypothetical protein B1L02_07455 [Pseudoalteromonas piscicida]AXR02418.1 hypothetical protein D0511_10310 [Pseudoalteromonas piscicida]
MKKYLLGLLLIFLSLVSFIAYCGFQAKYNVLTSCHMCSELKKQSEAIKAHKGQLGEKVYVYDYSSRSFSKYQIASKLVLTDNGVVDIDYAVPEPLSIDERLAQVMIDKVFDGLIASN